MLDIYETLEIKQILQEISSLSKSEINKPKILSLRMYQKKDELKYNLLLSDEMQSCLLRHNAIPLSVSFDIFKYIEIAKKDGVLSIQELDHVANEVNNAIDLIKYFVRVEKHLYPNLVSLSDKLIDISYLENDIHSIISPNLTIYDNASATLLRIRQKIMSLENSTRSLSSSLIRQYKDYLTETSMTIRNGHFVLPVKSEYKNKVSGAILDISDSGQTTFIEPTQLLELSNQIYLLKKDEQEEIHRLLKELTVKVFNSSDKLMNNANIINIIDMVNAKATYGNIHNGFVANLVDERIIDIKGARHPLIDNSKVVANDFLLNEEQRLIIISGPNAGGKTIALKTLGLMVMMNQMAIPLPTLTKATLSFFPKIYADIGDNQSLSDNLSTFAAHISNLSTITYFVTSNDLVLLDELGTGTSPNEGEAIALATSDFLLEKKCFGIISSHFEAMKEYAYRRDNVVNALMLFDEKKLLPTYTLKIGLPGRSYGLEMARRYHLKDSVIEDALKYLNKSKKRSINDVLDKLNNVVRQNESLNEELKRKSKAIELKEKDLNYQIKVLEKKKENLLSDVTKEKEELLNNAEEEINKILRVIANPNTKQVDLIEAKKKIQAINNNLFKEEDNEVDESLKVNDYVEITSLGVVGKIISIKGNKIEVVSNDGMTFKTSLEKVARTNKPVQSRVFKNNNVDELIKLKTDVGLELNIIGLHVDEGIEKVSKYLDDARIKHYSSVRIIHGMGTGALRKAVHEYLAKCDFIKEYHYGGYYDGGTGATVVTFK